MDNKGYEQGPDDKNSSRSRRSKQEEENDTVDLSCGVGSWRTNILGAKFANLYVFSVVLSISAIFHGMVSGVIESQITSIMTQFNIDNSQVGLLNTASRAGFLITILIPGHFAKRGHIPLMVAASGILQGLVLMVPGFLQFFDPYELPIVSGNGTSGGGDNDKFLCSANPLNETRGNNTTLGATDTHSSDQTAYYILMGVKFVKGVLEPFHAHSLMVVYMDDNTVDKRKMAHFIGIQTVIMDLATPLSKNINGWMTEIPVDLKPTTMNVDDQRFVAAWWLCFLAFGIATIVFSIPIMLFPRRLISEKKQLQAVKVAQKEFVGESPEGEGNAGQVDGKGLIGKLKSEERRRSSLVLQTPDDLMTDEGRRFSSTLVVQDGHKGDGTDEDKKKRRMSYGGSVVYESNVQKENRPAEEEKNTSKNVLGSSNFKQLLKDYPKAFYRLFTNIYFVIGIVDIFFASVPLAGTGTFRNLYVSREFNIPMKQVLFAKSINQCVSHILGTAVSTWISSRVKTKYGYLWVMAGMYVLCMLVIPWYLLLGCDDLPVYGAEGNIGIAVNSTIECGCDMSKQLLSCGADGNVYYSPCAAGCEKVTEQTFSQCTKMVGNSTEMTVTPGLCESTCWTHFFLYILFHGFTSLLSTSAMIPRRLLALRVVDPRDRGFAHSLQAMFWVLLALPAPNLFGKLIDACCNIFSGKVCSLYDRQAIRYLMSGIDVFVSGLITVNVFVTIFLLKCQDRYVAKKKAKKEEQERIKKVKEMTAY